MRYTLENVSELKPLFGKFSDPIGQLLGLASNCCFSGSVESKALRYGLEAMMVDFKDPTTILPLAATIGLDVMRLMDNFAKKADKRFNEACVRLSELYQK